MCRTLTLSPSFCTDCSNYLFEVIKRFQHISLHQLSIIYSVWISKIFNSSDVRIQRGNSEVDLRPTESAPWSSFLWIRGKGPSQISAYITLFILTVRLWPSLELNVISANVEMTPTKDQKGQQTFIHYSLFSYYAVMGALSVKLTLPMLLSIGTYF